MRALLKAHTQTLFVGLQSKNNCNFLEVSRPRACVRTLFRNSVAEAFFAVAFHTVHGKLPLCEVARGFYDVWECMIEFGV